MKLLCGYVNTFASLQLTKIGSTFKNVSFILYLFGIIKIFNTK